MFTNITNISILRKAKHVIQLQRCEQSPVVALHFSCRKPEITSENRSPGVHELVGVEKHAYFII